MIKKIASLGLLLSSLILFGSCSTIPTPRTVRFDVEWVRSTTLQDYFGYRHPERTAPLLDGNTVYQGNARDGLVAFDRISGRQLWRINVKNGLESGVSVAGDNLYFGASDGQFYAVNKLTGKPVWTFPTRSENLAAPLVADGIVYFLAGNNILYALDAQTGKQIWVYNRGETSSLSIRGGSQPAIYKGVLYCGFSDGYLAALNVHDGTLIWERKLSNNLKFIDVDAGPIVDENNIWVSSFDGALFCLSRADGQIQWRLDDGGATSIAIQDENLYFASLSQNIYSLNKKTGTVNWKFNYEEKFGVPTRPVLYKGLIIFGASDGDLMALSEITGKILASYEPGAGVFATPVIDNDGNVFVYSNEANLHVLKIAWRRAQDQLDWPEKPL